MEEALLVESWFDATSLLSVDYRKGSSLTGVAKNLLLPICRMNSFCVILPDWNALR